MSKHLFIGGSQDGQRHSAPDCDRYVSVKGEIYHPWYIEGVRIFSLYETRAAIIERLVDGYDRYRIVRNDANRHGKTAAAQEEIAARNDAARNDAKRDWSLEERVARLEKQSKLDPNTFPPSC